MHKVDIDHEEYSEGLPHPQDGVQECSHAGGGEGHIEQAQALKSRNNTNVKAWGIFFSVTYFSVFFRLFLF